MCSRQKGSASVSVAALTRAFFKGQFIVTDQAYPDLSEAARLRELMQSLPEVVAEKSLLSSDWSYVRTALEGLYLMATVPTRLVSPWPELCAYRLAHILMRDARDEDHFRQIVTLLDEPCGQAAFGARPHLLRVAALYRLQRLSPLSVSQADIKLCFDKALEVASRRQDAGEPKDSFGVTQRVTANLIEQTAYLLDLPFIGKADPDIASYGMPSDNWTVLIRGLPAIWMTEPLARLFYQGCVERMKPAIEFECVSHPPRFKIFGESLKGLDAICGTTLCVAEHEDHVLWSVLKVQPGRPIGAQLGDRSDRLNKHLSLFKAKLSVLSAGRLEGAGPIEGTLGGVNLRFADTLDHVGLYLKGAEPKSW